jgi:hypothetical protein
MALQRIEKSTCGHFGRSQQINNRFNPCALDGRGDGLCIPAVRADMMKGVSETLGGRAREADHLVPGARQMLRQRQPNEATGAYDQKTHALVTTPDGRRQWTLMA